VEGRGVNATYTRQLRGQADKRQVDGARTALQHNGGFNVTVYDAFKEALEAGKNFHMHNCLSQPLVLYKMTLIKQWLA
jgi:hypothetical protein